VDAHRESQSTEKAYIRVRQCCSCLSLSILSALRAAILPILDMSKLPVLLFFYVSLSLFVFFPFFIDLPYQFRFSHVVPGIYKAHPLTVSPPELP
jgi:hypothetical protein